MICADGFVAARSTLRYAVSYHSSAKRMYFPEACDEMLEALGTERPGTQVSGAVEAPKCGGNGTADHDRLTWGSGVLQCVGQLDPFRPRQPISPALYKATSIFRATALYRATPAVRVLWRGGDGEGAKGACSWWARVALLGDETRLLTYALSLSLSLGQSASLVCPSVCLLRVSNIEEQTVVKTCTRKDGEIVFGSLLCLVSPVIQFATAFTFTDCVSLFPHLPSTILRLVFYNIGSVLLFKTS